MIRKIWFPLLLTLYLFAGSLFLSLTLSKAPLPETDMTWVNRIVKQTEENWEAKSFQKPAGCPYEYAVISGDGTLLYRSLGTLPVTVHETIRSHGFVLTAEKDGQRVGQVLIFTGYPQSIADLKTVLFWRAEGILLLTALLLLLLYGYLDASILTPFQHMKDFTRHIAAGNLDIPLPMDKKNAFGAFTESFDLMREEIRRARREELKANKSKRELTASLSHDIKTPVTSIKLVCELLLATKVQEPVRDKIQIIGQKAEQINLLVSNLLQSSLEDLGELTIRPADESSQILAQLIREADCYGCVTVEPIPPCLIRTDRQRLSQVLDNIIYNSIKYAGTPVSIGFRLEHKNLILICRDHGKGVPSEELPLLCQKYYRGSNGLASKADGTGLGLYISRYLMEKMGGGLECYNLENGFSVELILPILSPVYLEN